MTAKPAKPAKPVKKRSRVVGSGTGTIALSVSARKVSMAGAPEVSGANGEEKSMVR